MSIIQTPVIEKEVDDLKISGIASSTTLRQIVANISWASFEKLLRLGGGLLVGTAVARYLGPDNFGVYSYAYAIYSLFNILSSLGIDLLVIKDVTLTPESENTTLGTAFLLKAGASVLTTIVGVLLAVFLRPNDSLTIKITALLSLASIFQAFEVVGFFFQAKLKSRLTITPAALVFAAACLARVIAVLNHCALLTFAWIAAVEIALTQLSIWLAYILYRKEFPQWRFTKQKAIGLLQDGWPLMLSSFLIVLYMRCDQIILGMFRSTAVVGDYSAAVKLVELWYSLPIVVCGSIMPQLLRSKNANLREYRFRLQRLYDLMAVLSVVVAVFTMLFDRSVIALAFGSKYAAASPILAVYIWTGVFVFLGIVGGQQMTYDGLAKIQLRRSVFGAVMNILLNFMLVPSFGAIGSAVSTLIVQAVVSYGLDLTNAKTREMFWLKTRAYLFLWAFDRNLWNRSFWRFAAK